MRSRPRRRRRASARRRRGVAKRWRQAVSYAATSTATRSRRSASIVRQEGPRVFVAASSECFPQLSLDGVLQRLVDLEYNNIEIAIHEHGGQLKPSEVLADLDRHDCQLPRDVSADDLRLQRRYRRPKASCTTSSSPPAAGWPRPPRSSRSRCRPPSWARPSTPRSSACSGWSRSPRATACWSASKTEIGRITQDPDTAVVLCDNVKGLGITLDPSHYIYGPHAGEQLRPGDEARLQRAAARHEQGQAAGPRRPGPDRVRPPDHAVGARSTTTGRCRSTSREMDDVDHAAEMRKMRLLLESLL